MSDQYLAGYIDVGFIDFVAVARRESSLSSGADGIVSEATSVAGKLSVEYIYAAIPEPAAYAVLIGLAALGMAVFRARLCRPGDTAGC